MRVPTVHLNGTSKASLIEGYLNIHQSVEAAIDVLRRNCPNARDYYTQGNEAFSEAAKEHQERLLSLLKVSRECMEIAEAISDQGAGR